MIGRMAIVVLAVGLAGCAGLEPAGRNAAREPRSTTTAPAPRAVEPPPVQLTAPAATPAPTPAPPRATTPTPAPAQAAAPQQRSAPAATPAPTTPAPVRQQAPVAAPSVSVPTPAPTQQTRAEENDDDIVVPGQVQTQIPPPAGDPRSNEERRADVRAWDRCITQVQSAFDSDPMRPQLTTPEEYCSTSLGMADRTAVPVSRSQRRR